MSREADRLNRKIISLPVDITQISEVMIVATVAGEDINFAIHHGINWNSTKRAFMNNVVYKKKSGGGSTITQQVVKNLFLSHKRSYIRKVQEIFLALVTEKIWGKKKILETYLNIAEFGEGLFGVEAAAQYYFNKNAKNLSKEESLWLVAVLPNPKYFQKNPKDISFPERIKEIERFMKIPVVSNVCNEVN